MGYRDEVREGIREGQWTVWKIIPPMLLIIVVLSVVGFGMRSLGLIGNTAVEREVFEQSYQRSEALSSQIATDEATIAQIDAQLRNPNLDDNTRFNLQAQKAAAEVRIQTARSKQ